MPFPVLHPHFDSAGPSYTWIYAIKNSAVGVELDTGQLVAGAYNVWVDVCKRGVGGTLYFTLEHRDAPNLVTLHGIRRYSYSGVMSQFNIGPVAVATNERFRISCITNAGVPGLCDYSILYARVGP